MSMTLLISQPLILLGTVFWLSDADGFEFNRWEFYVYWLSHSLPMFVFIFIKPREDCFNCFNRQAPAVFSCFQFTLTEIRERSYSDTDHLIFADSLDSGSASPMHQRTEGL